MLHQLNGYQTHPSRANAVEDSERSEFHILLLDLVRRESVPTPHLLEIGCKMGHLAAKLAKEGSNVLAIDNSLASITQAREAFASLSNLDFRSFDLRSDDYRVLNEDVPYGLILFRQPLAQYSVREIEEIFLRLQNLLAQGGKLLIVSDSDQTGDATFEKITDLARTHYSVLEVNRLKGHSYLIATSKRPALCLTIDYEALEFPPDSGRNRKPDLQKEVVEPTEKLMTLAERFGCRLTLFVEVAQIAFWDRYAPDLVLAVKEQIQNAFRRGHDIQLHLHPRWLIDLGARYDASKDQVLWPEEKISLAQLNDQELEETLTWADHYLRSLIAPVDPSYHPNIFRAGKYQIQPHARVFRVLERLGYQADSSTCQSAYADEYEGAPGYDFRHLWTMHEPFFPMDEEINLPRSHASQGKLVEIPIYACDGETLNIDTLTAEAFRQKLESCDGKYIVALGHSKNLGRNLQNIEEALAWAKPHFAMPGLRHAVRDFLISADTDTILKRQHQEAHVNYLQKIPGLEQLNAELSLHKQAELERVKLLIEQLLQERPVVRILDFGCGTGELFTLPLAWYFKQNPRVVFIGYDLDEASIVRARAHVEKNRLENLQFNDKLEGLSEEGYDLVCGLNVLEYVSDPEAVFRQLALLVRPGGTVYISVNDNSQSGDYKRALVNKIKAIMFRYDFSVKLGVKLKHLLLPARIKTPEQRAVGTLQLNNRIRLQSSRAEDLTQVARQTPLRLVQRGSIPVSSGILGTVFGKSGAWWFQFTWPTERNEVARPRS